MMIRLKEEDIERQNLAASTARSRQVYNKYLQKLPEGFSHFYRFFSYTMLVNKTLIDVTNENDLSNTN